MTLVVVPEGVTLLDRVLVDQQYQYAVRSQAYVMLGKADASHGIGILR